MALQSLTSKALETHSKRQPLNESLPVPSATCSVTKSTQPVQDAFVGTLRSEARKVQDNQQGPITVIAPFGGSRIAPFDELGAAGVVILDWDRPGSPEKVEAVFRDPKSVLCASVKAGLEGGGMDTRDVMASPVVAQLMAKLEIELGVKEVNVSWHVPQESQEKSVALDGEPVSAAEGPIVTRLQFTWKGTPRELLLVSHRVTSDSTSGRSALPEALLKQIHPQGFSWGYFSADGLAFFSDDKHNGLHDASQKLADGLRDGGAIVLDYPKADFRHSGSKADGINFMAGRADLKEFGLKLTSKIDADGPVFGYAGGHSDDEVRIYQKPVSAPKQHSELPQQESQLFNLSGLKQLGPSRHYTFENQKSP